MTGYVAVIEWRSAHEDRPSWSTSGGQSAGGCSSDVAAAGGVVVDMLDGDVVCCFAMAAHEAIEVQERHLTQS